MKTKFFTGVGDQGISNTGKKQLAKDDPVFMLLGSLDECTSWLGLARVSSVSYKKTSPIGEWLHEVQEMLFISQAEVATIAFDYGTYGDEPRKFPSITEAHTKKCEKMIEEMDAAMPALKHFVLPGGSVLSAQCDIARTIARKAERYAVIISRSIGLSAELLAFLNRLSSVLFVLARYTNFVQGIKEARPTYT